MNFIRKRPWLMLGVAVVAGLSFGGLMNASDRWGEAGPVAVLLAALVAGIWLMRVYWQALDEAAREAQKEAWLWGGSLGLAATLTVVMLAAKNTIGLDLLVPADATPEQALLRGATLVVGGQVGGYVLAWALWWWRRR